MDQALVDQLAALPLEGITREYPNKLDHVINGPEDLLSPRELHPAFYGCYDWHSAVHGHWALVRLLRLEPTRHEVIRQALDAHLAPESIKREVAYLRQPNRESFERPYGWAWLLKLAEELHGREDKWSDALKPLTEAIVERFLGFLPKQTYPIRSGVHSNTAFSLILALDYALTVGNKELEACIRERALNYFGEDSVVPQEPSGADFLSPTLTMAALMVRFVDDFSVWFEMLFRQPNMAAILVPAVVSDRDDPQIGHLDGLNFSRAWCMNRITDALSVESRVKQALFDSQEAHLEAALPSLRHDNYNGSHWLGTFALLAMTDI